jgi:predicted nucleic acid-binding protein
VTKALLDTNIILDIAERREPFVYQAMELFNLMDQEKVSGFVSANTITDIYYISKKKSGHDFTIDFIRDLLENVKILKVDEEVIL